MVDVWKELGLAVGRALKPLKDMGAAIWTAFGAAASDLITGLMEAAEGLSPTLEPTITKLMPAVLLEATAAMGTESPPEEIKEAVEKFIEQLMAMIETRSKTESKSLPSQEQLLANQAQLVAGVIGMYAVTHAISMALDATQPLKDWGFKSAIMDMLFQFKMSDVIGPMIQAPIWASVVTPLRMRARQANQYEVPGTGVLPYLHAKGLIDAEAYILNMSYHAYDGTWSAAMLENTWRYPSFSELRTMVHRGAATWEEAEGVLEKSLIKADYIDKYKEIISSLPAVSDLVRFAVREAYPDADTFEEHYAKMTEWLAKTGYSEYFATAFWTAHWVIPTISQADELLHRGDIDEAEHEALYILNDIRPEDIPRLRSLTWKRPGRIESRWMFRWGEIDATDLRDFLIDDGLDPAYADRVALAMAKNQFLSDINRQIVNIKADYSRGYSVESTLRTDLEALGQRPEIVEYHVVDALDDRVRTIKDGELRTLRAQYARGALTLEEVIEAVTPIIIDEVARDAWIAALPTAKTITIIEETYGTEINRLVANAKNDYVRGYILKAALVSRLEFLDLPDAVIDLHVLDADEDRNRRHQDKTLAIIEEGHLDDLIEWENVEGMAGEILKDEAALELYLDEVWLNKHKAVRT